MSGEGFGWWWERGGEGDDDVGGGGGGVGMIGGLPSYSE